MKSPKLSDETKRVLARFIRGGLSGMFGAMSTLIIFVGKNLTELGQWCYALLVSAIAGFIGGFVLAADKYYRDKKDALKK